MIAKLLIGAGAMKAGSTWLYRQLSPHPAIHFTPIKELCYFSYSNGIGRQLDHGVRDKKYQKALSQNSKNRKRINWYERYARPKEIDDQWYAALFTGAPKDAYCADFSNLYALLPEPSLAKIQGVAQQVNVIYTLRDPLERLWSQVKFHFKFVGNEYGMEHLSDAEFKNMITRPAFWNHAEYLANYRRLVNVFGKEHVRLFYLENFTHFPQESLWDLEKFLDISRMECHPQAGSKKINKTKDIDMPESFKRIAQAKLLPIYEELYAERLHHPSWRW